MALGLVRARRGDPEAWSLLDEAKAMADQVGSVQYLGQAAVARAEAAWLRGRPEIVAQEIQQALVLAVQAGEPWPVAELLCWMRRLGLDADAPLTGDAGPFSLELAGRFVEASAAWDELGCPYDAALALVPSGDEALLRRAHERLRELGTRSAAAVVARKLRATGARDVPEGPRARTAANPAGLTARELEVLDLLCEGLRNAEIAARLVVSERTVAHHVSAILRKLDVPSRARAVSEAARLGVGSKMGRTADAGTPARA